MSVVVEKWLNSGQYAEIENIKLLPRARKDWNSTPIRVECGQASVYFLLSDTNSKWVLKKFNRRSIPDHAYNVAIQHIIPNIVGFESGYNRLVLCTNSLGKNGLYSEELLQWQKDTILMPHVTALEWSTIASRVRSNSLELTVSHRQNICLSLIAKIHILESLKIAHRDLSSLNIMIDLEVPEIHLIDWDSIYHKSLKYSNKTTFGTNGYIAPFVKGDSKQTWCEKSDRFSLAALLIEILGISEDSFDTHDGGVFEQSDLDAREGDTIDKSFSGISNKHKKAIDFFKRALRANSFEEMPSPLDWARIIDNDIQDIVYDFNLKVSQYQYHSKDKETITTSNKSSCKIIIGSKTICHDCRKNTSNYGYLVDVGKTINRYICPNCFESTDSNRSDTLGNSILSNLSKGLEEIQSILDEPITNREKLNISSLAEIVNLDQKASTMVPIDGICQVKSKSISDIQELFKNDSPSSCFELELSVASLLLGTIGLPFLPGPLVSNLEKQNAFFAVDSFLRIIGFNYIDCFGNNQIRSELKDAFGFIQKIFKYFFEGIDKEKTYKILANEKLDDFKLKTVLAFFCKYSEEFKTITRDMFRFVEDLNSYINCQLNEPANTLRKKFSFDIEGFNNSLKQFRKLKTDLETISKLLEVDNSLDLIPEKTIICKVEKLRKKCEERYLEKVIINQNAININNEILINL